MISSTFSSGYSFVRSASSSKPWVHFFTNFLSYSFSCMMTLSIPKARAVSVAGLSCNQMSARDARGVNLGSTTINLAPRFNTFASFIALYSSGLVIAGLQPHIITQLGLLS